MTKTKVAKMIRDHGYKPDIFKLEESLLTVLYKIDKQIAEKLLKEAYCCSCKCKMNPFMDTIHGCNEKKCKAFICHDCAMTLYLEKPTCPKCRTYQESEFPKVKYETQNIKTI